MMRPKHKYQVGDQLYVAVVFNPPSEPFKLHTPVTVLEVHATPAVIKRYGPMYTVTNTQGAKTWMSEDDLSVYSKQDIERLRMARGSLGALKWHRQSTSGGRDLVWRQATYKGTTYEISASLDSWGERPRWRIDKVWPGGEKTHVAHGEGDVQGTWQVHTNADWAIAEHLIHRALPSMSEELMSKGTKGLGAVRTKDPKYGDWSGTRRSMTYGQVPSPEEFLAAYREELGHKFYTIENTPYAELNGSHDAENLYMLVVHMADEWESEGDEEAGGYASAILQSLGFEWI